jgi:phospholipid-binding lipoprotein MlaA
MIPKRICQILIFLLGFICLSCFAVENNNQTNNSQTNNNQTNSTQTNNNNPQDDDETYYGDEDQQAESTVTMPDPYEKFNRVMFAFNEVLDKYFMRPISNVYNKIMPAPLNICIDNVFTNFGDVPDVAQDLLQANFYQATADAWRLGLNSTIGIAGLFDVADKMGLPDNDQDFGLTLAKWGLTKVNYLVVPFAGPSSDRDVLGYPADWFTSVYPYIGDVRLRNSLIVLRYVDLRAKYMRFQKTFDEMALTDPYILMRNLYAQRRDYEIKRNNKLNDPYSAEQETAQVNAAAEGEDEYYLDE